MLWSLLVVAAIIEVQHTGAGGGLGYAIFITMYLMFFDKVTI